MFVSVSSEAGTWQGLQKDLWTPKRTSELCEFYLFSVAKCMFSIFYEKSPFSFGWEPPSLELSYPISIVIFSFPALETHMLRKS